MDGCRFPDLRAPYDVALCAAVAFIVERFDPLGIIASGTIVRGNPGPSSDLDLYVIHGQPFRQRVQRLFEGVPAEIFVNPPPQVETYFETERRAGRPLTAHMLATGVVVLDRDPVIERLRQQARDALALAPDPSPETLRFKRYMIATEFEDACDVAESDPLSARMIMASAVRGMLRYRFWQANRYQPRDKDLIAALDDLDPALVALARVYFAASDVAELVRIAEQIADRTIQTRGFFEWESNPEAV